MRGRDTEVGRLHLPDLAGLEPVVGLQTPCVLVVGLGRGDDAILEELRMRHQILVLESCPNLSRKIADKTTMVIGSEYRFSRCASGPGTRIE